MEVSSHGLFYSTTVAFRDADPVLGQGFMCKWAALPMFQRNLLPPNASKMVHDSGGSGF